MNEELHTIQAMASIAYTSTLKDWEARFGQRYGRRFWEMLQRHENNLLAVNVLMGNHCRESLAEWVADIVDREKSLLEVT